MDLVSSVNSLAEYFKPVRTEWSRDRLVIRQYLGAYAKAAALVLMPFALWIAIGEKFALAATLIIAGVCVAIWLLAYLLHWWLLRTIIVDKKLKMLIVHERILYPSETIRKSLKDFKCISTEEVARDSRSGRAEVKIIVTTRNDTKTILQTGERDASSIVGTLNDFLFEEEVALSSDANNLKIES